MIETERLVSLDGSTQERAQEVRLRPQRLADYIGQSRLREKLEIFLAAARARQE